MKEQNITTTEIQSICDKVSEELLEDLPQTNFTIDRKHEIALKKLLDAIRKQMNIPEFYPVFGSNDYSYKQKAFYTIQQTIHSSSIPARPFVIDFLKKVFGEEANFGDL